MDVLDFGLKPLRDYVPDKAYQVMCQRAQRTLFRDGQALQMQGDEAVRLCLVVSGAVQLGRFQHDGAFTMVTMLGPGRHFGEVGLHHHAQTHDVYAMGETEIDLIDAAALEDLLRHQPGFAMGFWRCNTARLNTLLELYEDARTLTTPQRLAKLLYLHSGRGHLSEGVACLHRDLAALLGVSQVSIGTAMKALESLNLVEAGYRCIIVKDMDRMRSWLRQSGLA